MLIFNKKFFIVNNLFIFAYIIKQLKTKIMKTISQQQVQFLLNALDKGEITKDKFIEIIKLLNDSLK